MQNKIPTPRTDAVVGQRECGSLSDSEYVRLSRELERELIESGPYIEIGKRWRENSSLDEWFPFSAQKLKALEAECGSAAAIIVRQNQELERLKAQIAREISPEPPGHPDNPMLA